MDKTVESFRMALESEISRWNGFDRALRKEDREAFDELMDMCRNYASESGNATNPIVFEPMVMSIILSQQLRIEKLERELQKIKPETPAPSAVQEPNTVNQASPETNVQTAPSGGGQSRLF
jgi:hypothetical protein